MEKEKKQEIAVTTENTVQANLQANPQINIGELMFDDVKFARIQAFAELMAAGRCTVPKHLQGNVGDCFAITIQAMMWGMIPFTVAQKTHLVNGVLGYEAALVNAVVTSMRVTSGRFHYEYCGDWDAYRISGFAKAKETGCGVRVGAILRGENEIRWLPMPLYMENVKTRNSPNWATVPQQQIGYLAVKHWVRLFAPDALLGVYSEDELAQPEPVNVTPADQKPAGGSRTERLKNSLIGDRKAGVVVDAEIVAEEDHAAATTTREDLPAFSALIAAEIERSKAPVTLEDVEKFLKSKGLLKGYGIDDRDKYPEKWAAYIANSTAALIDNVAQESVANG